MSKIKRLITAYSSYIKLPWRSDSAAAQRVVFCIYDEGDELRMRAKIDEFEIATKQADHGWFVFDLTDTFALWLSANRYAKSYYQKPELIATILNTYLAYIEKEYARFVEVNGVADQDVVAIEGVASLFGLLKVKEVVDRLAPMTKGRLLVFFPGSFENNNYRLLDGYDGWNYLAVPITAESQV